MRFTRFAWACWASAVLLVVSAAGAQDKGGSSAKEGDKSAGASAPAGDKGGGDKGDAKDKDQPPQNVGGYSWTDKPSKKAARRRPRIKIDPNAPIAMYPGFRVRADGTSQVWVYVSRKVSVTAAATSGQPTFVLNGAQVAIRNNTNALVTEYFQTPLRRARLKHDAAGAQLVLELREPVSVQHRVVDGPGGTSILYVDLPKPSKSWVADDFDSGFDRKARSGSVLPSKASKTGPKQ